MFYVPLYVEALRSRPSLLFWLATLAQAVLWLLVPLLFYAAPPGDLPRLLALGHDLQLTAGPPLAFWLGEIAFRAAGLFGVYLLSQACVVATYWCVFALGRTIVGAAHAAMAVLLMVGISAFTVPTPDFGPPVLAMALWAAVLLHYFQAVAQKRRRCWYLGGLAAALLLLASDAAPILIGALAAFTALTGRGRAALRAVEPWLVAVVLASLAGLHVFRFEDAGALFAPALDRLRDAVAAAANPAAWLRVVGALVVAHAGAAVLVAVASGLPQSRQYPTRTFDRAAVDPFAARFVTVLAIVPPLIAAVTGVLVGARVPIGGLAPLLVLSGLAVIVAAGDSIALRHPRTLGAAWAGLLIVPAVLVPAMIVLLPWTTATELQIAQPAAAMGRFFAASFERRTGHPLAIVGGDFQTAALVALAAPSRPSVYIEADPRRSPPLAAKDIAQKGAVVVWPAVGDSPDPPADIKAHFPGLIPEVPHTFVRPVRGRLAPLRIGWAVIRPTSAPAAGPRPR